MSGHLGGPPAGPPPPSDHEATQLGMPVPPQAPPPPPGAYYPSDSGPLPPDEPATPGMHPAGGPPPVLVGVVALLVVAALAAVVLYVGRLGPFAPAAANPTPTLVAPPSPTPTLTPAAPSDTPTQPATAEATTAAPAPSPTDSPASVTQPPASPTLPPTPPPTLPPSLPVSSPSAEDEAVLRSHVPADIVATCSSSVVLAPALASVVCTASDSNVLVSYTLYPDTLSMTAAYEAERAIFAPQTGTAGCADPDNWPAEVAYTIEGDLSGRVFCADLDTIPQMYWTDERFNIMSWALIAGAGSREDLYAFWHDESGPY